MEYIKEFSKEVGENAERTGQTEDALTGKLIPRDLLFPLSATAFWLFLTVKSLEARKWS